MNAKICRFSYPVHRLSVVLPAHNEEGNIAPLVERLHDILTPELSWLELIVVDDGSSDRTVETLAELEAKGKVRIVHHEKNKGYGATLRSGFAAARGDYIAFIDGDGQLEPLDMLRLLTHAGPRQLALGYRAKRQDPLFRVLLGKLFSGVFVPLTIGVSVKDVDCALKVLPRRLLEEIDLSADGALINAELLAHAKALGYRFHQSPVRHYQRHFGEQSGAKLSVIAKVFSELLAVKRRVAAQHQTATALSAAPIRG